MQSVWFFLSFVAVLAVARSAHVHHHLVVATVPAAPDGYPRPVIGVYNASSSYAAHHPFVAPLGVRPFPGPTLEARLGDTLHVRVDNRLDSEALSMHFHGLHMLHNAWMDGAARITECGIASGGSFEYVFRVTQTGTYWYHSHVASQYTEGVLGAIVLSYAAPQQDPVYRAHNYSAEFVIVLQDWFHEESDMLRVLYRAPRNIYAGFSPQYPWPTTGLLLNGVGHYNCSRIAAFERDACNTTFIDPCDFVREQCIIERESFYGACGTDAEEPPTFGCAAGERVRWRLINGAGNAPLALHLAAHNLTIVAKDGVETEPFTVPTVPLAVGQRYDVIVTCGAPGAYDITSSVAVPFLPADAVRPQIAAHAWLIVGDNNSMIVETDEEGAVAYNDTFEYSAATPLTDKISAGAAERVYVWYDVEYNASSGHGLEHWVVNGSRFDMPAQGNVLQDVYFGSANNASAVFANAVHLRRGRRYELVLFGADDAQQHPWHLHGYTLDFVAVGVVNYSALPIARHDACGYAVPDFEAIDWAQYLTWNVSEPRRVLTRGDTFTVPPKSFVVFRFTADNVGPWLCHCHVDWHMHLGMSFLVSVEEAAPRAPYASLVAPPPHFALCGAMATVAARARPLEPHDTCPAFVAPLTAVCVTSLVANAALLVVLVLCRRGLCVRRRVGEEQRLLLTDDAIPPRPHKNTCSQHDDNFIACGSRRRGLG